ncbi:small nuclear ribonucleoprotein G-like [Phyllostomus hastatus]|uniref:small nuclear ribonucleoprotein G-like n=1 Tax=Phyllostomus hastatus TaxID=9423 RepID=UPI001E6846B8|nr:small nuclear ribonucleoprotein G-like [Phyllostomus hastatus]
MDKKLSLKLNGGRHVQGILQGSDPSVHRVETATSGQERYVGVVVVRGGSTVLDALGWVYRTAVFTTEINSFHTFPRHSTHFAT